MFETKGRERELFRSSLEVHPPGRVIGNVTDVVTAAEHFWWENSFINLSFALLGRKPTPASTTVSFGL